MAKVRKAVIVGAGLGGLAAAIALRARGIEVEVFEQAANLGEVGAGVQLSPNAMKALRAMGVEQDVLADAFEPQRHVVRSWDSGREVSATQMKGVYAQQFGAGYYGFHRADLHAALLKSVPLACIRLDAHCTGVQSRGGTAVLRLADGSEHEADVLVGADGIHSAVRESLFGPESPRFTGVICWRGLVPAESLSGGLIAPDMTAWFGPKSTIVTYYVRGGRVVNWAAFCEADDWREESWRIAVDHGEVIRTYAQWHPSIRTLVEKTDRLYKWALHDRDPLKAWSRGPVTLLGDAAHPMLPYLAQGACMAIEDGYVLAQQLNRSDLTVEEALLAYQKERLPRTARVQKTSRERARVNQLTSPLARLRRDLTYAWNKFRHPERHTYQIEWIYGHDVTASRAA